MISHRIPKMFLKYQPRRKRHWENLKNDRNILFCNIYNKSHWA
jgi:hypothetical protein